MNKRYCSVNNWLVDVTSGSILHLTTGERKRLGEYQLKLLDILVQDAGKIFTREELTNLVWERRVIGNNSLPNAIHALRTALEDDGKNQRIIKTIPRKGYLLEAEYCCVVEKDEDEVSDPEEDRDVQEDYPLSPQPETDAIAEVAEKAADIQPVAEAAVVAAPKQRRSGMLAFMLVILLTATATAGVCWYLFGGRAEHLVAREVQPGVYSNIRLYTVEAMGDPAYMSANLYGKLKDSLYALNQQIKMQSATMNVYFHTNNSSLNYSFMLSNQCDKKQLAMAIYHWRTDTVQLNNVILRETRRKLNELATCKAN